MAIADNASHEDAKALEDLLLKVIRAKRVTELEGFQYEAYRGRLLGDPRVSEFLSALDLPPRLSDFLSRFEGANLNTASGRISSTFRKVRDRFTEIRRFDRRTLSAVERSPTFNPSSWTGMASAAERVVLVKKLVPPAMSALETLLDELETANHNGGPLSDDSAAAVEGLRALHRALGELLEWAERGALDDPPPLLHLRNFLASLAGDVRARPVAFFVSGIVATLSVALNLGEIGGWLAGVALGIKPQATNGSPVAHQSE